MGWDVGLGPQKRADLVGSAQHSARPATVGGPYTAENENKERRRKAASTG